MKSPAFKIGDAVMLQSGSKFMTIVHIDPTAQIAKCVASGSASIVNDVELPLRCLIRICDSVDSLSAGDHVMCRGTYEYMTVLQFDIDTKTAIWCGRSSTRTIPMSQLLRLHNDYE